MVIRTARRGKNAGGQFWGCSTYPECENMKPLASNVITAGDVLRFTPINDDVYDELEGIELGDEQRAVFKIMELTKDNLFITGKAGTGKSVLLKYFVKHTTKKVIVLAPTGVAAMRVGGQTIHSRFAFSHTLLDREYNEKIKKDEVIDDATRFILQTIDAFIIDEVSMVRADVMESINTKFQVALENDEPFGGVQMFVFGDLYQLPPVTVNGEIKRYLDHNFGGEYFFCAPAFENLDIKILELEHIFRQKEKVFQEMLNEVRIGRASDDTIEKFNKRCGIPASDKSKLTIATRNAKVEELNKAKLRSLQGDEYCYKAVYTGDYKQLTDAVEKELRLKLGSQVVMLRNDPLKQGRWVNGTLAEVSELTENSIKVEIRGVEHDIEPVAWHTFEYEYDETTRSIHKQPAATLFQYPLKLAWGLTIHKSQGQTYESVTVDFGAGAFVHGQAYVALSRCETLDNLYLIEPLSKSDIIVNKHVADFIAKHKVSIPEMAQAKRDNLATPLIKQNATKTVFDEGIFLVGTDIGSGLYEVIASEKGVGYIARLKSVSMDVDDVIAGMTVRGHGYVEIKGSDFAIKIENARLIKH